MRVQLEDSLYGEIQPDAGFDEVILQVARAVSECLQVSDDGAFRLRTRWISFAQFNCP